MQSADSRRPRGVVDSIETKQFDELTDEVAQLERSPGAKPSS
jgi:hypothetical protein